MKCCTKYKAIIYLIFLLGSFYCKSAQLQWHEFWKFSQTFKLNKSYGSSNYILLPMVVGNESIKVILDTGANFTLLDKSLEKYLGKSTGTTEATDFNNVKGKIKYYKMPKAKIGKLILKQDIEIAVYDFNKIGFLQEEIKGILGMDFLINFIVEFNFDKNRIKFINFSTFNKMKIYDDIGESFPLTINGLRPYIDININGKTETMLIDSGAYYNYLNHELFNKLQKSEILSVVPNTNGGLFSKEKSLMSRANGFRFGKNIYRWQIFGKSHSSKIGRSFLARHVSIFDFYYGKVYFKKGKNYSKRNRYGYYGFSLDNDEDGIFFYDIDKISPAYTCGLRNKDKLVSINGNKITNLSYNSFKSLFRRENYSDLEIEILRGGIAQTVIVKPKWL